MNIFEQLQAVIATTLRVPAEKITATTVNDDLVAWDSLGHVNVLLALEKTFDIFLEVEDFPLLTSVPAITAYLKARGID